MIEEIENKINQLSINFAIEQSKNRLYSLNTLIELAEMYKEELIKILFNE